MKRILYVTGSRAEYGIMKRLLMVLNNRHDIELTLVATGMHCDERYGLTYKVIEQDGFELAKLIPIYLDATDNANILHSMAICQSKFGRYFQDNKFDAVMLLGDRYEILSVAIAAAMHNLPIIHLHGGEKTLGNYDEFIRHAITKMSRLHLASTEEYRNRIIQLGEHPDSVFNVGALGAENSLLMELPDKSELALRFGTFDKPYFMVVFHPETLTDTSLLEQVEALLAALTKLSKQYDFVFIGSNSDTGADVIVNKITQFCSENSFKFMCSVKPEEYLALIKNSQGLIGNSSSGLIEVPSLHVPTINIGDRQKGRVRGETVIDCECSEQAIYQSIVLSQSVEFSEKVRVAINPYYQHNVLEQIMSVIIFFFEQPSAKYKDFYDLKLG
ncbi:UDP-N-acetylglucosamine 2-epimerase [Aeromonas hydrophila]|uniref:UDP-N-acetylglucosamine 2-epimerase n=1 Tax=Aeromonas hydrophila TaxID=644 RepID=UPI001F4C330A|nr:UDP-N-acetylglucosamine 2-epimerase [Aeromonas hydrophila]UNB59911.1 UDP-N-acetylglucosamine 2-epimerase [Aeromonas hydrophila]